MSAKTEESVLSVMEVGYEGSICGVGQTVSTVITICIATPGESACFVEMAIRCIKGSLLSDGFVLPHTRTRTWFLGDSSVPAKMRDSEAFMIGVTSAGEDRLAYWRQHDRPCRVDLLVVMAHRGVVVNSEVEYYT